jgi:hypothetical protein
VTLGTLLQPDANLSPARRRVYRMLDLTGIVLLIAGVIVSITGGRRYEFPFLTLSLRSESRFFFWAAVLLLIPCVRDPRGSAVRRYLTAARAAKPSDEAELFGATGQTTARRAAGVAGLVLAFGALVAALTWPQAAHPTWVSDLGDPLFSIWRIAWVSHHLPFDLRGLFDANIFYPEQRTLTYSDPVLVPSATISPLLWLGAHPVVVYNLLFLSGWALSGVTMYLLVRSLTGQRAAGAIAGAIFALYPFRYEHYSHLELQMTMWMPVALYALHRTLARERLRDGLLMGGAFALQTLSCLYYGVFFSVYLLPLTAVLWIGHRSGWRAVRALAAGGGLAVLLVLPVAMVYADSKRVVGERELKIVEYYSAVPEDYLDAQPRSRLYENLMAVGNPDPERALFPGFLSVALAIVALWTPLSAARIGYALALAFAFDASLGMNGWTYPWLHEHVSAFRSLRVPARFSMLLGMTLAVLAGYGMARIARRWPSRRLPITAAVLGILALESFPSLPIEPVWPKPPSIYGSLQEGQAQVLAEFPMAQREEDFAIDTRYQYFSIGHWQRMVNGNSGFFPRSYYELIERVRDFPDDRAIHYLRERGVTHVGVHGAFYYDERRFRQVAEQLDARTDLEMIASTRWAGSESRLYRFAK